MNTDIDPKSIGGLPPQIGRARQVNINRHFFAIPTSPTFSRNKMKARAEASRLHGPITKLGLVPLLLHDPTPITKKERSVDLTPRLDPDRYYRGR